MTDAEKVVKALRDEAGKDRSEYAQVVLALADFVRNAEAVRWGFSDPLLNSSYDAALARLREVIE